VSHFRDYTPESIFQAAQAWLKRGCSLLPCQKNSKFFLSGFGPVRKTIRTDALARRYFLQAGYNLAVVLHPSLFCLDFDDWSLFTTWSDATLAELQVTHTEITPRGAHVFYRGEIPPFLRLIAGVEVKRACLVAPSIVAGRRYVDIGIPGILEISDVKSLLSFLLLSEENQPRSGPDPASIRPRSGPDSGDVVTRIKEAFPITEIVKGYTELRPSSVGERRWLVGLCPFHADHKPSLWVDAERNLWGCHSCGISGDAINFYAREHNLSLQGAIRELAGRLPGV